MTRFASARARLSVLTVCAALTTFGYGGCTVDAPYLLDGLAGLSSAYVDYAQPIYYVDEFVYDEPYDVGGYYTDAYYLDVYTPSYDYGYYDGFGFEYY